MWLTPAKFSKYAKWYALYIMRWISFRHMFVKCGQKLGTWKGALFKTRWLLIHTFGGNQKKEEKSGRVFRFAPPDRQGLLRYWLYATIVISFLVHLTLHFWLKLSLPLIPCSIVRQFKKKNNIKNYK